MHDKIFELKLKQISEIYSRHKDLGDGIKFWDWRFITNVPILERESNIELRNFLTYDTIKADIQTIQELLSRKDIYTVRKLTKRSAYTSEFWEYLRKNGIKIETNDGWQSVCTENKIDTDRITLISQEMIVNIQESFGSLYKLNADKLSFKHIPYEKYKSKIDKCNILGLGVVQLGNSCFAYKKGNEIEVLSYLPLKLDNHHETQLGVFTNIEVKTLDLGDIQTDMTTDLSNLFDGAHIDELDISHLDTSNVINMRCMFYCSSIHNLKIGKLDARKVRTMEKMFESSDIENIDLSEIRTRDLNNIANMFKQAKAKYIDVSGIHTENVTTMEDMFNSVILFKPLDLSHFKTTALINMFGMFSNAHASIDFTGAVLSDDVDYSYAFDMTDYSDILASILGDIKCECEMSKGSIGNFSKYNMSKPIRLALV